MSYTTTPKKLFKGGPKIEISGGDKRKKKNELIAFLLHGTMLDEQELAMYAKRSSFHHLLVVVIEAIKIKLKHFQETIQKLEQEIYRKAQLKRDKRKKIDGKDQDKQDAKKRQRVAQHQPWKLKELKEEQARAKDGTTTLERKQYVICFKKQEQWHPALFLLMKLIRWEEKEPVVKKVRDVYIFFLRMCVTNHPKKHNVQTTRHIRIQPNVYDLPKWFLLHSKLEFHPFLSLVICLLNFAWIEVLTIGTKKTHECQ